MKVSIIKPGEVIYEGQADVVSLPGAVGALQLLDHHAPILSVLKAGTIQLQFHTKKYIEPDEQGKKIITHLDHKKISTFEIQGGLMEMNQNLITILAD
ncbi:MAG: hypothetical protein ACMUEL_08125 [Flavobacteriales bacterium Tduv]